MGKIIVLLCLLFSISIICILLYFELPVFTRQFSKISNIFSARINGVVKDNVSKNKFLYKDRINIERQLHFNNIHFRGKVVDFKTFMKVSLLTGCIGLLVGVITTSNRTNINLPGIIITTIIGLIIPRWYLVIKDGKLQRQVGVEAPQALAKIIDFTRVYANMERAVSEASGELPKITRKYFMQAWNRRKSGYYDSFNQMIYDIGKTSKSQVWIDFAHKCLIDVTLGSSDRIATLRALQSRARKILLANNIERKSLNAKFLKLILAHIFLIVIWFFETFIIPSYGVYLYTTPIGKLLMIAVYASFVISAALFTYLYFDK